MALLKQLKVESLVDHPHNPRLRYSDEVVRSIATAISDVGGFHQQYAILVRPIGGDGQYQIVSGHHRKRAAKGAGCDTVWAWVDEEMTDEEAFMELVRSNSQTEMDPLEIGIHCYNAVDLGRGGNERGGVSEYARMLGRDRSTMAMLRKAGEVCCRVLRAQHPAKGMSRQLYEISKMPENCWGKAAVWLSDLDQEARNLGAGSIRDVKLRVDEAMHLRIPAEHAGTDLETNARLAMFLRKGWVWPKKEPEPEAIAQSDPPSSEPEPASITKPDPVDEVSPEAQAEVQQNSAGDPSTPASQPASDASSTQYSVSEEPPSHDPPQDNQESGETEVSEDDFLGVEPITTVELNEIVKRLDVTDTKVHAALIKKLIETEDVTEIKLNEKAAGHLAGLISRNTTKVKSVFIDRMVGDLPDKSKERVAKTIFNQPTPGLLTIVRKLAKKHFGKAKLNLIDKPVSIDEVKAYATRVQREGRRRDAPTHVNAFFENYQSKGWMIEEGKPVLDWRSRFLWFCGKVGGPEVGGGEPTGFEANRLRKEAQEAELLRRSQQQSGVASSR